MGKNSYFQFKQFRIDQLHSAMKVNTDSILLGGWCSPNSTKHLLDIGTGTGILALMMAQRFQEALIDAVEIDNGAIADATSNFEQSSFANQLILHHISLQDFARKSHQQYDFIVSNPPYFENGILAPKTERATARHTQHLPFDELLSAVAQLLAPNGLFAIVLPSDAKQRIEQIAAEQQLFIKRICWVKTTVRKAPKRCLIEFSKHKIITIEEQLVIHNPNGEYSDHFKQYTSDFYL